LGAEKESRNSPRFQGENFQKNLDLVKQVELMARERDCQPSQLALAKIELFGLNANPSTQVV
jgi:aryl-alcohol dehydrogenase-like predicted oxidoreductase